jgi:hypothetical protein
MKLHVFKEIVVGSHMAIIGRRNGTIKVVTIFNTARRFGRCTGRKWTIRKEGWSTELGGGRCGQGINSYQ